MIREIYDLKEEGVSIYSSLNENQLKRIYEPELGIFIAESFNVIERAMDAGYIPESFLVDEAKWERARELTGRFPEADIYRAPTEVISKLTGFPLTGGILSAMKRKPLSHYKTLIENSRNIAVLTDIENPTNIGAIFRLAAALGMDSVILSPDSCNPLYRRAIRVSMGSVFQIPWTVISKEDWKKELFEALKHSGFTTAATALTKDCISIKEMSGQWGEKTAVFLGSEGYGLPEDIIEQCDQRVMIPMCNGVDSLNVAAASAVIFWEIMRNEQ